jgi:predicted cupin superfamily sugar epimerase
MPTPGELINAFKMQPHPEGGWYRQTYKANEKIASEALPERFSGDRNFSTAIYFLLEKGNFSAFHKIKSDECWHFYDGDPLNIYIIYPDGTLETTILGNDFENGQQFQFVVPAGCWFASRPAAGSDYCFVGCTVAPGFEFEDFEMAEVNSLEKQYPQHEEIIRQLCR